MSIQEFNPYRYTCVEQLEEKIVHEVEEQSIRFLENSSILVPRQSEIGQKVTSYVSQLVVQFPTSFNGSRFIGATITVCPKVVVRFSSLNALCVQERPNNLFYKEIGKYIDVAPMKHSLFGSFTEQQERLELRNIHFPAGAGFSKNEWPQERYIKECEGIAINTTLTIGTLTIDSELQKIRLIATIRFGTYEATQELQAETTDEVNLDLIVSLPHLCKRAKICYDGTAVFENGYRVAMEQLIGYEPVTWIKTDYQLNVEYDRKDI